MTIYVSISVDPLIVHPEREREIEREKERERHRRTQAMAEGEEAWQKQHVVRCVM